MKKFMQPSKKLILVVMLTLLYVFAGCQQTESESKTNPCVGKWMFVEFTDSAGVKYPATGVYDYYDNGTFTSQIITADRPNLIANPSTLEEYKAAFDGYRAGFGTYTVNSEEGTLTYEYTSNLRPHRIGQPTKVYFDVKNDTMTLNYKEGGFVLTLRRE